MLDFFGTVAITVVSFVVITAFVGAIPLRPGRRLTVTAAIGAFIGLSAALAAAGAYDDATTGSFPLVGVMFAAPLIVVAASAALFPAFRAALLALPMPLLIGLNAARVFGAFFLALAAVDRLGGPFPYSAGWGDVITGVLALPVAVMAARAGAGGRERNGRERMIGAWNAFGALDLVAAVALGVASAPGSPLQVFDSGAGSSAVVSLPWVLIPTVLVPFFLVTHGIVFAQLRSRAARPGRTAEGAEGATSAEALIG